MMRLPPWSGPPLFLNTNAGRISSRCAPPCQPPASVCDCAATARTKPPPVRTTSVAKAGAKRRLLVRFVPLLVLETSGNLGDEDNGWQAAFKPTSRNDWLRSLILVLSSIRQRSNLTADSRLR